MSRNRKSRNAHKKRVSRRPQIEPLQNRRLFAADAVPEVDPEVELNSITGTVYVDNNRNGLYDRGDNPVPNVTMTLFGHDLDGNEVSDQVSTNQDGNYTFHEIPAGTYSVQQFEQPSGLVDGTENVGRFKSADAPIERNGFVEDDAIKSIQLTEGDHGADYDFGELLVFESPRTFDVVTRFTGDFQDDTFEFIPGEETHTVIHNGEVTELDASQTHQILLIGRGGENSATIHGTTEAETVRLHSDRADYISTTFRVTALHTSQAVVHNGGGIDRVYLYDTEGDDLLRGTQNYVRMDGDGFTNIAYGFHRMFGYATKGGYDQAVLTDSSRNDTFKASSIAARMYGRDYFNMTRGFDRVVAKALYGGEDTAYFWDSPANEDIFQSNSQYARMFNSDFYNFGIGFENVLAYANQGGTSDKAYFQDTIGDDVFVSTPRETGISTPDYTHKARGFERYNARSTSGNDRAMLYDSGRADVFRANPEYATFHNTAYYVKVEDFPRVDAYATANGNDRAYFTDSTGDDTFVAQGAESRMYGVGFDNASHGFERTYAFPTSGGDDRVILYDGGEVDDLLVTDGATRLFGGDYWVRLPFIEGVDHVVTDLSEQETGLLFGRVGQSTITRSGDLAIHITSNSPSMIVQDSTVGESPLADQIEDGVIQLPGLNGTLVDMAIREY